MDPNGVKNNNKTLRLEKTVIFRLHPLTANGASQLIGRRQFDQKSSYVSTCKELFNRQFGFSGIPIDPRRIVRRSWVRGKRDEVRKPRWRPFTRLDEVEPWRSFEAINLVFNHSIHVHEQVYVLELSAGLDRGV
jgi:hypothetical protein